MLVYRKVEIYDDAFSAKMMFLQPFQSKFKVCDASWLNYQASYISSLHFKVFLKTCASNPDKSRVFIS